MAADEATRKLPTRRRHGSRRSGSHGHWYRSCTEHQRFPGRHPWPDGPGRRAGWLHLRSPPQLATSVATATTRKGPSGAPFSLGVATAGTGRRRGPQAQPTARVQPPPRIPRGTLRSAPTRHRPPTVTDHRHRDGRPPSPAPSTSRSPTSPAPAAASTVPASAARSATSRTHPHGPASAPPCAIARGWRSRRGRRSSRTASRPRAVRVQLRIATWDHLAPRTSLAELPQRPPRGRAALAPRRTPAPSPSMGRHGAAPAAHRGVRRLPLRRRLRHRDGRPRAPRPVELRRRDHRCQPAPAAAGGAHQPEVIRYDVVMHAVWGARARSTSSAPPNVLHRERRVRGHGPPRGARPLGGAPR